MTGTVFVRIADEDIEKRVQKALASEVKKKKQIGEQVTDKILDTLFQKAFSEASQAKKEPFSIVSESVFKPKKPDLTLTKLQVHSTIEDSLNQSPPSPKNP